jgi:hypothetical protein
MHSRTIKSKTNRTNRTNKTNKTRKIRKIRNQSRGRGLFLKTTTPDEINEISQQINTDLNSINSSIESYSPSINEQLVTLKSISRQPLIDCNTNKAFSLKNNQPLEINIDNKCYPYFSDRAKKFLLKNLAANKHINPKNIITPIQSLGNCWFNTMFVTLFVSDKGRKFFQFFRQLMIEGKTSDDKAIPKNLKNGLALLNYAVDACLTGNEFAYKMDTNAIIKDIYNNLPSKYKDIMPYITNIKEAGNPIRYYGSLIYYLHDESIQLAFISSCNDKWKTQLLSKLKEYETHKPKDTYKPHLIILEFFDNESKVVTNKPTKFALPNGTKYKLDSCIIRNTKGHHFSSLLTCEKKEYGYDGMSFHRLVPLSWKKHLNEDFAWQFEGSTDADDKPLEWNFRSGYQMLVYYRIN